MRGLGRLKLTSVGLVDFIAAQRLKNTLLINGFWRSGTTWLQQTLVEALNAKSLFEPFSPAAGHHWDQFHGKVSDASCNVYMPLSANCLTPRDRVKLHLALKGVGTHGYTHFLREPGDNTWSRDLVVKFTQLGFVLDDVADTYHVPVIHIRRHPAAVFASFSETDWSWRFEDVRLRELYSPQDYPKGSPERQRAEILLRYDQLPAERLAAMWSLSEASAQKSIIAGKAHLVRYEDVVDQGPGILNRLELSSVNIPSNDTASPVTTSGREQLSASQRLNDWQTRLTRKEIDTIKSVCNELFPDNGYFDNDASKSVTLSR
ncbi:sulfotransferase [Hyphomonas jannaschiana]|uniref:sulfotransferase n=1 Tax=Hyphomonas jannaschiana TaxID=86 RepID=UPI0035C76488